MSVRVFKHKVKSLIESEHEYEFHEFIFKLRQSLGASRKHVFEDTGISTSRLVNLENGNFTEFPSAEITIFCEYYIIPRALLTRKAKEFVCERYVQKSKIRRLRKKEKIIEKQELDAI